MKWLNILMIVLGIGVVWGEGMDGILSENEKENEKKLYDGKGDGVGRERVNEDVLKSLDATSQEGRLQYELMVKEAQMPKYGSCYLQALSDLKEGCTKLDDEVQSRLALSFTNCYLDKFGWDVYVCESHEPLMKCMGNLEPRAASVYAAMLTNTLAMCHFLQAQKWHIDTNKAVHSLRETSEAVTTKLAEAVDSAEALRHEMDLQISESRQALKSAFLEFRESTAEQRGLIVDVFDKVAQLHTLLMGEFSWFYAMIFYVVCVLVTLLLTCGARTHAARMPILGILGASIVLERMIVALFLTYLSSYDTQENMEIGVWIIRRLAITLCCLLLVYYAVSFKDPLRATAVWLEELTVAAREMKDIMLRGTACLGLRGETEEDKDSDSDSDDDDYDDSGLDDDEWLPVPEDQNNTTQDGEAPRYNLRPRDRIQSAPNPILEVESPTQFALKIKSLIRHPEARGDGFERELWRPYESTCTRPTFLVIPRGLNLSLYDKPANTSSPVNRVLQQANPPVNRPLPHTPVHSESSQSTPIHGNLSLGSTQSTPMTRNSPQSRTPVKRSTFPQSRTPVKRSTFPQSTPVKRSTFPQPQCTPPTESFPQSPYQVVRSLQGQFPSTSAQVHNNSSEWTDLDCTHEVSNCTH